MKKFFLSVLNDDIKIKDVPLDEKNQKYYSVCPYLHLSGLLVLSVLLVFLSVLSNLI